MRSRTEVALLAALPLFHFQIIGPDQGAWPGIFSSVGLTQGPGGIQVVRDAPADQVREWMDRVKDGAIVVVEGESELAGAFGFIRNVAVKATPVRSIVDEHSPKLQIVWERAVDVPTFTIPAAARIFTREQWRGIPLVAGLRYGAGAVLWIAITPGERGHERFPYLLQALTGLGFQPPFRSHNLWAFFDASYRSRVDLDYFAPRWRQAGIAALQVAAWHFWEPDPQRDEYLRKLIDACHRQAITVYAWLELPHVSEQFWREHPAWREKTGLGQDAFLDWRKLMDLNHPECKKAVGEGLERLIGRFDWDGVNLAELYFESLEGVSNAARFTPMNSGVRAEFSAQHGFDPMELFSSRRDDAMAVRTFLDWRAELAGRMQEEWIDRIEQIRVRRTDLGLVLTHVDDRYDTRMRDAIGADAARVLPLLARHDFTFLVEDPATLWNLGPERYPEIAARYGPLSPRPGKLAIDINIVERYQDVYPTKQQTGTELFQLVHTAAAAFPRVALYFENSILAPDLPLLAAAAALPERAGPSGGKLVVQSTAAMGVRWDGPAKVDGQEWPYTDGSVVWLPPGAHAIEGGSPGAAVRLLDFSAEIRSAATIPAGIEFSYRSDSRAFAVLDRAVVGVQLDGAPLGAKITGGDGRWVLALPRGQHLVAISVQ